SHDLRDPHRRHVRIQADRNLANRNLDGPSLLPDATGSLSSSDTKSAASSVTNASRPARANLRHVVNCWAFTP
ncbi:hypothetical protein, partial [Bradyrhizobium japonicum]|uniref:hypothetical protein n=1 Tax=Bradyrhizobium japonicum TaxID=375 RepID=UPI001AEEE9DF